jgi:hypothetical protein
MDMTHTELDFKMPFSSFVNGFQIIILKLIVFGRKIMNGRNFSKELKQEKLLLV